MRLDNLLYGRDDCVPCGPPPVCTCPNGESCSLITKTCTSCYEIRCDPNPSSPSGSSGGVSKGALAGAVIGVLIFLGLTVGLFWWYRRSPRFRKAPPVPEEKPDVPAAAEDVLKRPDPIEKPPSPVATELNTVRVYSTSSNTTIDLDPESQSSHHSTPGTTAGTASRHSVRSNPFSDTHSIQTAVTEGTNVIPIALVSPESSSLRSNDESTRSASPVRPVRTPEMDLNLDHVNVSHDSLRSPANYALSQRSGVSGVSSRNSYMSGASYSSDFLHEAPMIVTANKGPVRQVLGVRKAEMVSTGSLTPTSADGLKVQMARPAVGSPLAATSFGPSDVASVSDKASEDGVNPFSDRHASTRTTLAPSSAGANSTTFATENSPHNSVQSTWTPQGPLLPWSNKGDSDTRPSSISTQAGSVIDIASATRVNVGLGHLSPAGTPRSQYRTTMGRLVSPPTGDSGTFEEQQQRALTQAQSQSRRISGSSVLSSTSTRADSILESFPFVPPSPISNRPVRSPPVSPLAKQSFGSSPSSPSGQQAFHIMPPSPSSASTPYTPLPTTPLPTTPLPDQQTLDKDDELPAPPNRRMLGLSTGSQMSTASSGLGSFPFQIDSGDSTNVPAVPSSFNSGGRQRASLDTLAITSDLSSYPLGFDRDSNVPPLPR